MSLLLGLSSGLVRIAPRFDDLEPVLVVRAGLEGSKGISETHLTPRHTGIYEIESDYAGDVDFLVGRRTIALSARWYGEEFRYVEIRLWVSPGAELAASYGLVAGDAQEYFLASLRGGRWAELHYDNHAHAGIHLCDHPPEEPLNLPSPDRLPLSRWERIQGVGT